MTVAVDFLSGIFSNKPLKRCIFASQNIVLTRLQKHRSSQKDNAVNSLSQNNVSEISVIVYSTLSY